MHPQAPLMQIISCYWFMPQDLNRFWHLLDCHCLCVSYYKIFSEIDFRSLDKIHRRGKFIVPGYTVTTEHNRSRWLTYECCMKYNCYDNNCTLAFYSIHKVTIPLYNCSDTMAITIALDALTTRIIHPPNPNTVAIIL